MYFPTKLKNKVKSILVSLDSLKQDFSALVLLTFWAGYFYGVGGCPLYCKMVSSIPKCLWTQPNVGQRHLQLRATALKSYQQKNTHYVLYVQSPQVTHIISLKLLLWLIKQVIFKPFPIQPNLKPQSHWSLIPFSLKTSRSN